jgi:RNA recognition motif-containing protein
VFGLSLYTTERELEKEFSRFGPLEKCNVVLDGKVSICCGVWVGIDQF